MARSVSLQLVAVIDGKTIPIKTVDYTENMNEIFGNDIDMIVESDIIEYLENEFYDGDSGI